MRIVLADPATLFGRVLGFTLNAAGHEVVMARNGAEALATVSDDDGVILGSDLPDMEAVARCAELLDRRHAGSILIVSDTAGTQAKLRAFDHGADDYVVRPCDLVEVAARVVVMARRRARMGAARSPDDVLRVGDIELPLSALTVRLPGRQPLSLTPTEMRILAALMHRSPLTVTREALGSRGWGGRFDGDTNRVDVYVMRLRKKLEVDPARPQYIQTVRGQGYAFRPSTAPQGSSLEEGDEVATG